MAERGETTVRPAQVATYATRKAKDGSVEAVGLQGRLIMIPFAYAEAGHHIYGFATTLHKAQGAALDPPGTSSRPMTSTSPCRKTTTEHQGVREDDALVERLRETINHSDAKTLAVEDVLSLPPGAVGAIDAALRKD